MKKVFKEVNFLDKRCYEKYYLSEDILMENASQSIKKYIDSLDLIKQKVLIVCGKGNNGADGIALSRMLHLDYDVRLYLAYPPKSALATLQLDRAISIGVEVVVDLIDDYDIVVDSLYGSGIKNPLSDKDNLLINTMNNLKAHKIACDIPSGIDRDGFVNKMTFIADTTITMGAIKLSLLGDNAKNVIGNIQVADLGISEKAYTSISDIFLLEESDLVLPIRVNKNSHKYTYGHSLIFSGQSFGAGLLSAKSSLTFGSGAVSIMKNKDILKYDESIMYVNEIPQNTSVIIFGMGLGKYKDEYMPILQKQSIPMVIDADMFYHKDILYFLNKDNIVLTPHPKEFVSLLKITNIADIDIQTLQQNRFSYVDKFTSNYPNITILLKGANVIIAQDNKMYINSLGGSVLSKAGSGDVLNGLIGALLSQQYSALQSAINASLAHSIGGNKVKKNNYALSPLDIIDEVSCL